GAQHADDGRGDPQPARGRHPGPTTRLDDALDVLVAAHPALIACDDDRWSESPAMGLATPIALWRCFAYIPAISMILGHNVSKLTLAAAHALLYNAVMNKLVPFAGLLLALPMVACVVGEGATAGDGTGGGG